MGFFPQGLQMMLDGQQRFIRSGLNCFLRIQNFAPQGDFQELGVPFAPSGTQAAQTGFVDLLIDPPPEVKAVSTHNIGMSGGKLMFGARIFLVSHTFVQLILDTYPAILDPYDVWRNWDGGTNQTGTQTASVIGLIYEDRMYSIEDIVRNAVGGKTVSWKLTCNFHETQLGIAAGELRQF